MNDFLVELNKEDQFVSFKKRVWNSLISDKMGTLPGVILLLFAAAVISTIIALNGFLMGIVLAALVIGFPTVIVSLFNLRIGTYLIILLAFFVLHIKKINPDIPLGLVIDLLVATLTFGLFINQFYKKDWSLYNNPISKIVLVWILYNVMQFVNPWADSREAWLYTVRGMAGFMLMYFIIFYTLKDIKSIKALIYIWVGISVLGGVYGFYQELFGFLPFEWEWLNNDPETYKLIFIWGRFRIFSFFAGPTVFGLMMTFTSIICFVFLFGPYKKITKLFLIVAIFLMLFSSLYSGTRAAYAVLPIGLLFYALLSINKKILIAMGFLFVIGVGLVFVPTSNVNLKRFQSAFKPSQDASYLVRMDNQKKIQPYIQTHPIGGGLGSTGVWGRRFSPNSELAKFPPDSTYMRVAVELGWVGLLIYLMLYFIVFYVGIKNYKRLKNPLLKNYLAAMLTVMFAILIANFPQEATGQLPIMLLFYIPIAIINRIMDFDN